MWLLDLFKNNKNKHNNSMGMSPILFSGSSFASYRQTLIDIINKTSTSYPMALTIGETNPVVSRFIDMVCSAINFISIVDDQGKEVKSPLARKILDEVNTIFADNGDWTEYVYHSINMWVCCGMKVASPAIIDEKGYASKIEVLDNRTISFSQNKDGSVTAQYASKKLDIWHKTVVKPDINRRLYGSCIFSGAIKDAIIDKSIKDVSIGFWENNADPSTIYMLDQALAGISQGGVTMAERFEQKLKEKFQSPTNRGLPLATTALKDVKTIDASPSVINSISNRLYSSKMLGMQLGVDIRGLGFMRDGGSQAELLVVFDQLNTVIGRRSEKLSASLTNEYKEMVGDMGKLQFKFIPTYYRNQQQIITNALTAHKQKAVDDKYVQDLLSNQ